MDIIDKLKKGKKSESVFESLVKKKEIEEGKKEEPKAKQADMEVTQFGGEKPPTPEPEGTATIEKKKPAAEFRAEGLRELDMESLGVSGESPIKVEYMRKLNQLVNEDKIDEAISLLQELKAKLSEPQ